MAIPVSSVAFQPSDSVRRRSRMVAFRRSTRALPSGWNFEGWLGTIVTDDGLRQTAGPIEAIEEDVDKLLRGRRLGDRCQGGMAGEGVHHHEDRIVTLCCPGKAAKYVYRDHLELVGWDPVTMWLARALLLVAFGRLTSRAGVHPVLDVPLEVAPVDSLHELEVYLGRTPEMRLLVVGFLQDRLAQR
eukprot:2897803-Rhodomonas_salina.1